MSSMEGFPPQELTRREVTSSGESMQARTVLEGLVGTLMRNHADSVQHRLPGQPDADVLYLNTPPDHDGTSATVRVERSISNPTKVSIIIDKRQQSVPVNPSQLSYFGDTTGVRASFWGDHPNGQHYPNAVPYVPGIEEVRQLETVVGHAFIVDRRAQPKRVTGIRRVISALRRR